MNLLERTIPVGRRVRQRFPTECVADPRSEVCSRLLDAGLRRRITPGARVAVTAGSRGMGGFVELLKGIIDAVKASGAQPFIVPAMGSHGGATAEGQVELLNRLGVSDQLGAPVCATMETRSLGTAKSGAEAHLDAIAAAADGIIVLGRTAAHPENRRGVASGLLKMVTVGLGKQRGAQEAHSHGLWESVTSVPQLTFAASKILFGVAVVENAYHKPASIEVVPATCDAFHDADMRLLQLAKKHAARIPFNHLDLLIVDRIGKDISGTGMDLNVIGRWRLEGGPRVPDFFRIVALSLTDASLGNGLGIGLADFTTDRFVRRFDLRTTGVNLLTACEPGVMNAREGALPLAFPTDREAIQAGLQSALPGPAPRICRIRSTAELDDLWISDALTTEAKEQPQLEIAHEMEPFEFNPRGDLF